jgi:hypothetical protein
MIPMSGTTERNQTDIDNHNQQQTATKPTQSKQNRITLFPYYYSITAITTIITNNNDNDSTTNNNSEGTNTCMEYG